MSNPRWLNELLGGLMVAVAVYSAARLIAARMWSRPIHRDIDVTHVLMGTSMAGQLVSVLDPVPPGVWELVFGALAVWFIGRCYEFVKHAGTDSHDEAHVHRLARRVIHLMMALAMLYMYLAAVPGRIGTGMAMGTPTGAAQDFVLIPLIFIFGFLGSAVWTLDSIVDRYPQDGSARTPPQVLLRVGRDREHAEAMRPAPDVSTEESIGAAMERGVGATWLAPRLEEAAHVVMVVTMAYMLVLML